MSLALVSAGLSVAGSLAKYQADKQAAARQEKAFWENRDSSILSRDLKIRQLSAQTDQQLEQSQEQGRLAMIEALKNQARAKVAGGESGAVSNNNAVINDKVATSLRTQQSFADALYAIQQNTMYARYGLDAEMINRINSMPRGQAPSLAGALVGAAGSGVSSYVGAGGTL